jgi:hypothetical protein
MRERAQVQLVYMSGYDVLKVVLGVIASLGGGGAIVLGLSGWLGKVWAERLMEKERHEHAQALESDRAKYAKELEALKAKYEQTHRRLQNELDKTIYGHQLKTQTEFNALMELWKKVPPLESALHWARMASVLSGADAASLRMDQLTEATKNLQSLLSDFGPFVDARIYENLKKMISIANEEYFEIRKAEDGVGKLSLLTGKSPLEDLGKQIFNDISDRLKELSQYDRPSGPEGK